MSRMFARLTGAALLLAATAAAALPPHHVMRSGSSFYTALCAGPAVAGHAICHTKVVTDQTGSPVENDDAPGFVPPGLGPQDLRSAYNLGEDDVGDPGTLIAVVAAFGYKNAEADLAVYRAAFGLPPCTSDNGCFSKVNQSGVAGPYPGQKALAWAQESALDLEMASAMCPKCSLVLVEANTDSYANLGAAVATAATLGAHVITNSYGGDETGTRKFAAFYDQPGVAVVASTGDVGYGVQFPAASPKVIAVGGTTLTPDSSDRGWSETAWAGGGSGCSALYAKPNWQNDPSCPNRMVADIAAVADPATAVAVYAPSSKTVSSWQKFAGTSVGAPLIGGIYGANGGTVHYGRNPYNHPNALNDITSGSNGTCTVAYFCNAQAGYDGPTGMGSPNGLKAFGQP